MAVVNSYILYTLQNPDKRRRLSHEQFRVTLATDLLHIAALATGSVDYGPRRQSLQPVLLGSLNGIFQSVLAKAQLVG